MSEKVGWGKCARTEDFYNQAFGNLLPTQGISAQRALKAFNVVVLIVGLNEGFDAKIDEPQAPNTVCPVLLVHEGRSVSLPVLRTSNPSCPGEFFPFQIVATAARKPLARKAVAYQR